MKLLFESFGAQQLPLVGLKPSFNHSPVRQLKLTAIQKGTTASSFRQLKLTAVSIQIYGMAAKTR
jgi:hypothetical protein